MNVISEENVIYGNIFIQCGRSMTKRKKRTLKNRNPIAKVVTKIRNHVIPDKRKALAEIERLRLYDLQQD